MTKQSPVARETPKVKAPERRLPPLPLVHSPSECGDGRCGCGCGLRISRP